MNNSIDRHSVSESDSIANVGLECEDQVPVHGTLPTNDTHHSHDEIPQEAKHPSTPNGDHNMEMTAQASTCESSHLVSHATSHSPNSSEDEFVSSDDDFLDPQPPDEQRHTLFVNSSVAEHTAYFEKSLNETLDSLKLDDSLVLQAQLSGQLNKKSSELNEKKLQIANKIQSLKILYKYHITEDRIGKLESDIKSINTRVSILTSGVSKSSVFGKSKKLGVCDRYPVEFNKARDKVLERASEP